MDIFKDIPEKEYRAINAINQSTLKLIEKSKAHFLDSMKNNRSTPAMVFGSALHDKFFMGDKYFYDNYEVCAYREKIKDKSKQRIKESEFIKLEIMIKSLREKNPEIGFDDYLFEKVILWEMEGFECKGKLDMVSDKNLIFGDLKTISLNYMRPIRPQYFNFVIDTGADFQAAFYQMALKILTGKIYDPKILFIDKAPPYKASWQGIPQVILEQAKGRIIKNLRLINSPFDPYGEQNYPTDGQDLIMPEWYLNKIENE